MDYDTIKYKTNMVYSTKYTVYVRVCMGKIHPFSKCYYAMEFV